MVGGAKITLTDPATGETKTTVSSGTGLYDIAGLNAANYNLKITAKGFQAYEQKGVVVDISRSFRVDVKLTVGAETQTVTVEADALAVQGDSNVVSTLINEQQITELATNGRNVVALAALGLGCLLYTSQKGAEGELTGLLFGRDKRFKGGFLRVWHGRPPNEYARSN